MTDTWLRTRPKPFLSYEALIQWIYDTEDGQRLLSILTDKPPRRVPVLIVTHSDGWVEVYGSREDIDALIVQRLTVNHQQDTQLADDYMTLTIPERYLASWNAPGLRAMGQCEVVTASGELQRLTELGFLRELKT